MNGGLWGFLVGAILLIIAFLTGRKTGVDKGKEKAEEVVSEAKSETAEAEYAAHVADTEKKIMQETVKIIVKDPPVIRRQVVDPVRVAESVVTGDDGMDALRAMQEDSERRAEELGRHYEN